jgi:signal transduction histidine kinase
MFESAVNKLTAWYVAALLVIVVVFSLPVFSLASNRLDRATQRQGEILRGGPDSRFDNQPPPNFFLQSREDVVRQERSELLRQILVVDVIIVIIGAVGSYYFAKRTLKPIQEAHEAQSRFTADASHELRTPLAVMQTEIEVALRNKDAQKNELRGILASNLEEIARLRILSDQLLALTKVGTNILSRETFSLSKAVTKRISELEKQYDISITTEIKPNITFVGDEHLLMEIVTILVSNAVQYSVKNPKILVSLLKERNVISLNVSDEGIGIKPEEIETIFERFYRGTNGEKQKSGHGLGLALAKEIALKSGGELIVESEVGVGSVFTLTLVKS